MGGKNPSGGVGEGTKKIRGKSLGRVDLEGWLRGGAEGRKGEKGKGGKEGGGQGKDG